MAKVNTTATNEVRENTEMSSEEFRRLHMRGSSTRSKYGNVRAQSNDGRWFDSKAECARYEELLWLQQCGQLSNLECQPVLELQPKFKYLDETIRAITYRADFAYDVSEGAQHEFHVIEDVKGKRTSTFNIKWKMAKFKYPDYVFRLENVK